MTRANPAAVVLAGGLGTRMRSATPKHFHPLLGPADGRLGRRSRTIGRRRPDRRRHLARRREQVRRDRRRRAGRASRDRRRTCLGTRCAERRRRRPARALGRHADVEPGAPRELCSKRIAARVRRPRCSHSVRPTPASTGASSATEDGTVQAIVEAGDATPEELAVDEVNSSIYVFAADRMWPALEQLDAREPPGRAVPHRRRSESG